MKVEACESAQMFTYLANMWLALLCLLHVDKAVLTLLG